MPITLRTLTACLIIALLAVACGGGGSSGGAGDNNTPNVPEPPLPVDPIDPPVPAETFSMSGTISTSTSQLVDSDTNDPNTLGISNDDP
ncbi:MAG: hypothetical protein QMC31_07270, partial [Halioglobus sp.]